MLRRLRSLIVAAALAGASLLVMSTPAAALPAETTWTTNGLREMVRISGHLQWSIDGVGIADDADADLDVEKPAGATVLAAYLMVAQSDVVAGAPSEIDLAGTPVTFTHGVTGDTGRFGFNNAFADVTAIVAPIVDPAPAGVVAVPVNEGASLTEGTALVVVFDDPAVEQSSVALYFGRSDTDGDAFSLSFPALTTAQLADLRMSVGISYSYQPGQDSTIEVNGQVMADEAGDYDDCVEYEVCNDGALMTIGGVGDDLVNPVVPAPSPFDEDNDDELYSLSPFVAAGDTAIDVETRNASGDDNLFFAGFFLDDVALDGAAPVGSAADPAPEAPVVSPAVDAPGAPQALPTAPAAPELAATGASPAGGVFAAIAALLVAAGAGISVAARRRHRRSS
jgi:hypothetical protein